MFQRITCFLFVVVAASCIPAAPQPAQPQPPTPSTAKPPTDDDVGSHVAELPAPPAGTPLQRCARVLRKTAECGKDDSFVTAINPRIDAIYARADIEEGARRPTEYCKDHLDREKSHMGAALYDAKVLDEVDAAAIKGCDTLRAALVKHGGYPAIAAVD